MFFVGNELVRPNLTELLGLHVMNSSCEVIKLLHDMKAELEADAANDQSVYPSLSARQA